MSLFYQLVFVLLCLEACALLVILAPMPHAWRNSLLKRISSSSSLGHLKNGLNVSLVFVFLLFLDGVNKAIKIRAETLEQHHHHDARTDSYLHAKLFYAQRNVYLTGSTIFLALILNRFYYMILDLLKNEEKAEVLKKQAAKTSKEYMKLLDGDQGKDATMAELRKEVEELRVKSKDLEVVKKQAERTTKEYMELTDRYIALEKKLSKAAPEVKKDK